MRSHASSSIARLACYSITPESTSATPPAARSPTCPTCLTSHLARMPRLQHSRRRRPRHRLSLCSQETTCSAAVSAGLVAASRRHCEGETWGTHCPVVSGDVGAVSLRLVLVGSLDLVHHLHPAGLGLPVPAYLDRK